MKKSLLIKSMQEIGQHKQGTSMSQEARGNPVFEVRTLYAAPRAERAQAQPSGAVPGLSDKLLALSRECESKRLAEENQFLERIHLGMRDAYSVAAYMAATPAPEQAQPSGAVEELTLQQVVDAIRGRGIMSPTGFRRFLNGDSAEMTQHQIVALCNLFATPAPAQAQPSGALAHSDDLAVDAFSAAMKVKLARSRAKGRGGWETKECTDEFLAELLMNHTKKGDPVDVANLAMMLHQRNADHIEIAVLALRGAALDFAKRLAPVFTAEAASLQQGKEGSQS